MFLDLPAAAPRPADPRPPLVIDNFAGGGGASTGIEAALGRPIDVAINHDEAAVAVHKANHPHTRHYCQSVWKADPLEVTAGAPVALAWFSPDCKHFSKAKGGTPVEKNIRDLAWVVVFWAQRVRPAVIMLENVEEFRTWGPLGADNKPCPDRKGMEFARWVKELRKAGYRVEHRELKACDYGAPTSRKRLFLIARNDGLPIVWPAPTHGAPTSEGVRAGRLKPWRTAAECIDWSIPCPSIFGRRKELRDATKRRIAAGIMRYVVTAARPFIVPVTHRGDTRAHSVDEPLRTITTANGGEFAACAPTFVRTAHGEVDRSGKKRGRGAHSVDEPFPTVVASQDSALAGATLVSVDNTSTRAARSFDPQDPLRTVTSAGGGYAAAAASMIKLRRHCDASDPRTPLDTITAGSQHHGIATANMIQMGYGEREGQAPRALDVETPLGTVVAGGGKHGLVTSFLHKYRPGSDGSPADAPVPTVTANSHVKRSGGAAPLAVTAAHLEQANTGVIGHDTREPLSTIVGKGSTQRWVETTMVAADALPPDLMDKAVRVAAFLVKYYGSEVGQHQRVDAPIDTIPTKARFAVVTVTIDATTYVLVDIGMRMLTPRELANAQGFPPDYILDPVCDYRTDSGNLKHGPLPKAHQIAKIGNSVCPVMAETLVRANVHAFAEAMAA